VHFADGPQRIEQVLHKSMAKHAVEAAVGKWQGVPIGGAELDIGDAPTAGRATCLFDLTCAEVDANDLGWSD
jgi:hypothetical protein